jgi:hypothetical protein
MINLFQIWDQMFTKIWHKFEVAAVHNNISISSCTVGVQARCCSVFLYNFPILRLCVFVLGLETFFSSKYINNCRGLCNCIPLKYGEENRYKLEQGQTFNDWTFERRLL